MPNQIRKLFQFLLIKLRVRTIVAAAITESWPKVRVKTAGLTTLAASDYVGRHAAATVHRHVELLMRRNPAIDGIVANVLIVKASERVSRQLLRKVASESRTLRRAA